MDGKQRLYFFDAEIGEEHRHHPLQNSILASLGPCIDEERSLRTEIRIYRKAMTNVAPYTWTRETQRVTVEDFGGRPVKVKKWSPDRAARETFLLVPETTSPAEAP